MVRLKEKILRNMSCILIFKTNKMYIKQETTIVHAYIVSKLLLLRKVVEDKMKNYTEYEKIIKYVFSFYLYMK